MSYHTQILSDQSFLGACVLYDVVLGASLVRRPPRGHYVLRWGTQCKCPENAVAKIKFYFVVTFMQLNVQLFCNIFYILYFPMMSCECACCLRFSYTALYSVDCHVLFSIHVSDCAYICTGTQIVNRPVLLSLLCSHDSLPCSGSPSHHQGPKIFILFIFSS